MVGVGVATEGVGTGAVVALVILEGIGYMAMVGIGLFAVAKVADTVTPAAGACVLRLRHLAAARLNSEGVLSRARYATS